MWRERKRESVCERTERQEEGRRGRREKAKKERKKDNRQKKSKTGKTDADNVPQTEMMIAANRLHSSLGWMDMQG